MRQQVRQGLVLIAVAAVVFLTRLGATRLWDDDETFFAEVAREMFERGDFVVPWFNQALFSHKPPFMYWMMMGAYHVFGVTEFAARLPSALFATATLLVVWRLGRILYSPAVGFWTAIILATSLNFVVIARAATSDAELIFFCTLSIYLFVRASATTRPGADGAPSELAWDPACALCQPSWAAYALVYAAMGIAVLVKGPIGVVLPTSVLGLFLLCQRALAEGAPRSGSSAPRGRLALWRDRLAPLGRILAPGHIARTVWQMRPLTAIAMVAIVAGPWFAAVGMKTHGEFLEGFFGVHHFHRFTSPMDNHSGPGWYYLVAICVGFFPWIIFLSPSLGELRRVVRERHACRRADVLVCSWLVVWIGFFSLASTKFPHYVVPAYPALALLTASFLGRWIGSADAYGRLARRGAWATVAAAGVGILIVVPIVSKIYLAGEPFLGLAGLPLAAGAALCAYLSERRQISRALAALTATAIAFLLVLFGMSAVRVDRHQNTVPFADAIRRRAPDSGVRIGAYRYFRPGLVYYCQGRVELLPDSQTATEFLQSDPARTFLVTTESEFHALAAALPPQIGVLQRSPWFLKSNQTLVLLGDISSSRHPHPNPLADRRGETLAGSSGR